MEPEQYEQFMHVAMREAEQAFELGEVPVGAVVVFENKVIGRGHNQTFVRPDAAQVGK